MEIQPPKEGWFNLFRRNGRFGEFVLLAWCAIEANLDISFLMEFDLLPKLQLTESGTWFQFERGKDKRTELLLSLQFNRKLDFLRTTGAIKRDEYITLSKFQRDRNKFFHGRDPPFVYLTDEEKAHVMKRADDATKISFHIVDHCLDRRDKRKKA